MQQIQQSLSVETPVAFTKYSVRQRLMSGSLSLAVTSSVAVSASFANTVPQPFVHSPVSNFSHVQTNFAGGPVHVVHPVTPTAHTFHTVGTSSPAGHAWHPGSTSLVHSLATQLPGASDLNLASTAAIFSVGTLAGFSSITLDIGGHQTTVDANTKLTGAELVAAQQVISGGKQTLALNATGAASGGTFNLNSSSVSFLDSHVGGNIGALDISHGVTAVDSVRNLNLNGSLVNQGTIDLAASAKGQTDTISAAGINNSGVIQSAAHSGAAIALNSTGDFTNSGKITSATDLSVSATNITNSGTMTAKAGNVNITGVAGGDINVNNAGGTVKAASGAINFNDAGYSGAGNVTLSGGNWLSQQVNINAGTGAINANVGEVSGVVNGTACSSHVTAATGNLQLGNIDVSGDPTYFNTAGNITIDGALTGNPDLAIVAKGNIIGGGGSIDTSAGNGNLTIIAGASFTPTTGGSGSATPPGDTGTLITVSNSATAGKGSSTGGFIDLSGKTLIKTGTPITALTTGNGNVLMVAYKGSGANSGSIVATDTTASGGAATTLAAGTGSVTLIGGGAQITAQNITAGNTSILAGTPLITGGTLPVINTLQITNGTIDPLSGTYGISGTKFSNTAINNTNITSSGNVIVNTAGKIVQGTGGVISAGGAGVVSLTVGATSGTAAVPININASGLSVNGTTSTASVFLQGGGTPLNLVNSTLGTGATLSIKSVSGIFIVGGNTVSAGTVDLTDTNAFGINNSGGVIAGGTANLSETGTGSINVNTAVNTLSVNAPSLGSLVFVNESASSAKSLTLNASSAGGNFTLTSSQTVNVKGAITTTNNGNINLTETGSTNAVGLNIAAVLTAGGSGAISLTTSGTDTIIGSKPVVNANITINAGGTVGTAAAGFQTNASNSLTINGNAVSTANPLISIKDIGTGTLNVSGTASGNTQSVSLTSLAPTLNVGQLSFSNVTISDTVVGAVTTINPGAGNSVGNGTGTVKITTNGAINQGAAGNINGAVVTLSSTASNIGAGTPLNVSAGSLTAGATKGSVSIDGNSNIILNTATALGTYTVLMDPGTALTLGGTITASTKISGAVSLTADTIIQGPSTAFVVAPNVTLATTAGGTIGLGAGLQSIQTKAALALSITGATNSTAFVTQTGSLILGTVAPNASVITATGTGSTLNLTMAAGSKLTVGAPITWDNNNITSPVSVTVTTGNITGTNATITSPLVTINNAGGIAVGAAGTASFVNSGILTINGTGSVTLPAGSSLSLFGQTGITLPTTGNDPLSTGIKSNALSNLTIFTKGTFTGNYSGFTVSSASLNDTLSITANILKITPVGAINLQGANVLLSLAGVVNVGSGAGQYDLASGINGGTLSVTSTGVLTVDPLGLNFTGAAGNSIALLGSTLNTALIAAADANYFTSNNFASVTIGSTLGTAFTIGGTTATELKDGISGGISASGSSTVSAPNIVVDTATTVQAPQVTFNTGNFKLNGTSLINGTGGAASLTISNNAAGGLLIGGTGGTANKGGTYTNFDSATLQSTNGGVNVGSLFTTVNGANNMLDSGSVSNLTISAAGALSLPNTLSTLQVANSGTLLINAASLSYAPLPSNPQKFLTLQATGGSVQLFLTLTPTSTLTLGQASGAVDISVGPVGVFTASTAGTLVINELQTVNNATLLGSNITVNKTITTTGGGISLQALGTPSSQITEGVGATLVGAAGVFLAQGLQTLPTVALNMSTQNILLASGAFNLNNAFAGDVSVGQVLNIAPVTALTLVNSSGLNGAGSTLTVNSILAAAGGITITNTNGGIFVGNNSQLITQAGSIQVPVTPPTVPATFKTVASTGGGITLINVDLTGTIEVGTQVTMSTFSTVAGGGQISVVLGKAVPTTGLVVGTQPGPFPTLNTATAGGQITFTTTANPTGSITSNGPQNQLTAKGTNIVFNQSGKTGQIILDGSDSITADPVVIVPTVPVSVLAPVSSVGTVLNASPTVANFSSVSSAPAIQSQTVNWSLPTTAAINSNSLGGLTGSNAGTAGIDDSTLLSVGVGGAGGGANGRVTGTTSSGNKVLTGGVSNVSVKSMGNGATLISPKTQTTLNYGFGSVNVAAGSVVMVMAFDGGLAVYNLHDTKSGAVVVKVGDNTLKLSPGQNAVVTKKQISCFEEINPAQTVAYRSLVGNEWGNGVKAFKSEFSILTMLRSYDALRNMVRAQDSETRKAMNSMLKTSAILSQLGGDQYEFMAAPTKTAMSVR